MLIEWEIVAALATAAVVLLALSGISQRLDNVTYDALIRATARPASADVIIVAIDDRALAELGRWPWSRRVHAALVDQLRAAGVRAIGYDVLFIEAAADPEEDRVLAAAVARSGRVCLPVLIEAPGRDGAAFALTPPAGPLAGAAAGLGLGDLDDDADGVSRRADLSETSAGRGIRHLMACERDVGAGGRTQPALPDGRAGAVLMRRDVVMIPYAGTPGRFVTVSAASVVKGEVPAGFLSGKSVVVGATAAGLHDRHSTPVSTRNDAMSGAELQATVLEGLLSGKLNRPAPVALTLAASLTGVWVVLLGLAVLPPRWNLMLGFAVLLTGLGVSSALLYSARIWLPPSPGALTLLIVFPLWGWRRLEATSVYMTDELLRFSAEAEPDDPAPTGGDPVTRQIALMASAMRRVRELRVLADAANAQRERVIQFLTHDMRSPQSSILAVLETAPPGAVPDEVARRISGYARRTLELADNFAHLARAESGGLDWRVLNLSDLVSEAADAFWPISQRAGVTLRCVGLEIDYLVRGDASLLARAIGNLIDNALKYGPAGGVVVCAIATNGDDVTLSVSDQGPGLGGADMAKLFERFGRKPGELASGIGLGLTLVDEVARRHGGRVVGRDNSDGGATFDLALPREISAA